MIYAVLLIALILLIGAAAVRNMMFAGAGAAALLISMTYIGISSGWSTWLVIAIFAAPLAAILIFIAADQVHGKRDLNKKMDSLREQQNKYRASIGLPPDSL